MASDDVPSHFLLLNTPVLFPDWLSSRAENITV